MRIEWDAVGERYFENGTDRGVLYPQDATGKYLAGVPWNGLTAVSESPSGGDPSDLWADNLKYATLRAAEKFGGTIEAYTYPDEFAVCDGSAELVPGVVAGQQGRKAFGFSYRTNVSNDLLADYYKIHLAYGCTCSPSDRSYATVNDSPDAVTFSWEFEANPVNITKVPNMKATALITIDSRKVDADKLAKFEDLLYGSETEEATLPTPDEVYAFFADTTSEEIAG